MDVTSDIPSFHVPAGSPKWHFYTMPHERCYTWDVIDMFVYLKEENI